MPSIQPLLPGSLKLIIMSSGTKVLRLFPKFPPSSFQHVGLLTNGWAANCLFCQLSWDKLAKRSGASQWLWAMLCVITMPLHILSMIQLISWAQWISTSWLVQKGQSTYRFWLSIGLVEQNTCLSFPLFLPSGSGRASHQYSSVPEWGT